MYTIKILEKPISLKPDFTGRKKNSNLSSLYSIRIYSLCFQIYLNQFKTHTIKNKLYTSKNK